MQIRPEEIASVLRKEIESFDYGKFAHIVDGDGMRVELWEANDGEYEKIVENTTS